MVMPTRARAVDVARCCGRCCCTRTWCNYSPPSFAFRLNVTVTRSEAMPSKRPTHSRRRARYPRPPLSPPFRTPFFVSERERPLRKIGRALHLALVPLCLLCITARGKQRNHSSLARAPASRNFSAILTHRDENREEEEKKETDLSHECTDPPSDSDAEAA